MAPPPVRQMPNRKATKSMENTSARSTTGSATSSTGAAAATGSGSGAAAGTPKKRGVARNRSSPKTFRRGPPGTTTTTTTTTPEGSLSPNTSRRRMMTRSNSMQSGRSYSVRNMTAEEEKELDADLMSGSGRTTPARAPSGTSASSSRFSRSAKASPANTTLTTADAKLSGSSHHKKPHAGTKKSTGDTTLSWRRGAKPTPGMSGTESPSQIKSMKSAPSSSTKSAGKSSGKSPMELDESSVHSMGDLLKYDSPSEDEEGDDDKHDSKGEHQDSVASLGMKGSGRAPPVVVGTHSSAVAQRFLDDNSENGPVPGGAATMNKSIADFHMSQLAFPTVTTGMYDDSSSSDRQRGGFSLVRNAQRGPPPKEEANVFKSRQDLREVDQSVNLMDADTGTYESKRTRSSRNKRQSMVEIFLGEPDDTFSGKKKRRGTLAAALARGNSFGKGAGDCCNGCCENFASCLRVCVRILCSWPAFICFAILGAALIVGPLIVNYLDNREQAPPPAPAPKPAPAPAPAVAPVPTKEPKTVEPVPTLPPTIPDTRDYATPLVNPETADQRAKDLTALLSEEKVDLKSTSSQEALSWMVSFDPAQLDFTANNKEEVLQRFAVASLFYGTHPQEWANTTSTTGGAEIEVRRQLLRNLESTSSRRSLENWMTDASICQWEGVGCNDGAETITQLNISHADLQGTLPADLTLLSQLTHLDVSNNRIHGSIPESYPQSFTKLELFFAQHNAMTGSLPDTIGEWTSLYKLDISENKMVGSLPTSISQLNNTRLLSLHKNQFSGKIPSLGDGLAAIGMYC